ncbi:SusC/RagA family TonB-linked outer membrane protein [Chitinophaga sp. Ak27]|uniref:SusC/RagA family TonB-linked outer membrane protein n=1 Tax=Chitinophaga sp. Ak27 TaxID=2726116 RepID=UPI00145CC9D5|nr:SusC/RagA family TonB-linked outer membrane protein [Chitinophaga sp. Ak27]NLU91086.1 SusC/RagA family TonB-linked outer membrane protein [Chitinophaga sp. Ak27]
MRWSVMVTVFILGGFTLLYANNGYSQLLQQVRVTEKFENESLASCVKKLESNYHLSFGYDNQELVRYQVKKMKFVNERLDKVLDALLTNTPLHYQEKNGVLLIVKAATPAITMAAPPQTGPGKIRGVVTDGPGGTPIPGVTVKLTGTKYYAVTNADGSFEITVPAGTYQIALTSIGFAAQTVPAVKVISGAVAMQQVFMSTTPARLTEAVVIGYGVQERRSLLGSVASYVPSKDPGQTPITLDQAMVGKLPGVYIAPSSGVPGAASSITIRGISTLNANGNAPLIVVDGVPIYGIDPNLNTVNYNQGVGQGFSFGGNQVQNEYRQPTTFEKNPLSTINPDDIESIEVLKDAYSTAIYGSRGSAGVILITTRKGARGKMRVDAQLSVSVSKPRKLPSLMTGDQYAGFYNELFRVKDSIGKAQSGFYRPLNYKFPQGVNTNWLDEVVRNAIGTDAQVSMSGGTDKSNYYVSLGYNKEQSYIVNNDFTRYQARVNFDNQVFKSLKVGVTMALNQATNNSLNAQNVYREAVQKAPNIGIYDSTGKYNWLYGNNPTGPEDVSNPVGDARSGQNYSTDSRVLGNVFADLKVLPGLTAHSDMGVDWINSRSYDRIIDRPKTVGGSANESQQQLRKWVINNRLDFNKMIGDGHAISAMVGQSYEKSVENINTVYGTQFLNDDMLSIITATNKRVLNSLQQQWAQVSYLGRLNYEFKHRYLAGVTYRMDGSSRFSANHRYVGFPSFAVGWVPSEESFLKGVKGIDQLKVRASVGFTGNDGGNGYYGNQGQYIIDVYGATYGNTPTIANKQPANPNLQWERTTTWNIGADISLLNGRINATLDYYRRQTSNAILQSALPYFMGFSLQQQNRADLSNKGLEFSVTTQNINHKAFTWTTTFNISANRNIVTRLHQINEEQLAQQNETSGGRFWRVGHSATAFYLYDWAGINPDNGQPRWSDNSGKISESPIQVQYSSAPYTQRKYMGDAMPAVFGGFGNNFTYKGFELNCFFSFAAGNKMYNGAKAGMYSYLGSSYFANNVYNLSTDLLNYWKTPGQQTDVPALFNKSNFSQAGFGTSYDYTLDRKNSRFLEDASFLKLRSLVLGYNFNSKMLKPARVFSALKVYAEANNVFILTKYSGLDPEVSAYGSSALSMGYDELTMPAPRTWRIGLKASF